MNSMVSISNVSRQGNLSVTGVSVSYILAGMDVGDRIKQRREELGLSQEAVGEALGITRAAVAQWELGGTTPRGKRMQALANVLCTRPEWLQFGTHVDAVVSAADVKTLIEVKPYGDVPSAPDSGRESVGSSLRPVPPELQPLVNQIIDLWASQSLTAETIATLQAMIAGLAPEAKARAEGRIKEKVPTHRQAKALGTGVRPEAMDDLLKLSQMSPEEQQRHILEQGRQLTEQSRQDDKSGDSH